MNFNRKFTAPTNSERCNADIKHGKIAKEGARCMRRSVKQGFCKQHQPKLDSVWVCACDLLFETEAEARKCVECGPRQAYLCPSCQEPKFDYQAA